MTLEEMKKRVYTLIEEYSDSDETLTSDEDISAKMPYVVDQVQNELMRYKKIPAYTEIEAKEGELITMDDIGEEVGKKVYQIGLIRGSKYDLKNEGTIVKSLEDGLLEIECYVYPTTIDENTPDDFKLELSKDLLEIMPYGVAGDLLKSDISNGYGNIYTQKYESLKASLDIRYNSGSITFEGGIEL